MFVLSCSFKIIPTGYTGVRVTSGQIDDTTVPNGFNWKIPFVQTIETVNNKQQDIVFTDKIWSETKERTAIYYENTTITYQINPEKSAWIYANVSNYKDALVSNNLVASAIKSSSKVLVDTDATNRSIIEKSARENVQKALDEKYGENVVIVNKVVIANADFDDSYIAAIAAKQKAQIEAEQQAIENQKIIDKAEAEARAKVIAAEAEADANERIEKSLSEKVLQQRYIEKWNGVLPQYVGGENGSVMVGMPGTTESKKND